MVITVENRDFNCFLVDDGTLDTVISIDGVEFRFDGDFVHQYALRDNEGSVKDSRFIDLCVETIDDCWDDITCNDFRR